MGKYFNPHLAVYCGTMPLIEKSIFISNDLFNGRWVLFDLRSLSEWEIRAIPVNYQWNLLLPLNKGDRSEEISGSLI